MCFYKYILKIFIIVPTFIIYLLFSFLSIYLNIFVSFQINENNSLIYSYIILFYIIYLYIYI